MRFREQVEKELRSFSKEEQVAFAWRCALRALPFLGNNGHFNFWIENDRQKRLYNILRALDLISIYKINDEINNVNTIYPINTSSIDSSYHSVIAATVSATSAVASSTKTNITYYSANSAKFAANAAIRSHYESIQGFILRDIQQLKEKDSPKINIKKYEEVWINFQEALLQEGCSYWVNWYKQLFKNNFEFDKGEVLQRINLPKEIQAQGAAAVGAEMERILKEGSERLNEARIIILGDKGVGKTCIAGRLRDPKAPMTLVGESTPGVDTTLWKLETETDPINVRIWDFAGHTVTHAAHQFFLSERSLYILVYDGRSEERNRLRYWLDHVKNYGGTNSKAIILVNEQDKHTVDIAINTLKAEYPIEGMYTFNIKSDTKKLQNFRKIVSNYIIHNPSWEKQQISKSYYQVKNELEKLFTNNVTKDKEFIQKEQFLKIAQKYGIEDTDTLLKSLHALGISLWYPGLGEYNTLILNPEWISDGVYQIINWVNNQDTHTVLLSEFLKIFKEEIDRFPIEKHAFLFNLMIKYELAYTLNGKRLVIPHLLNEDQPPILPEFPNEESLLLKYEINQSLPPNTISRFIVRHHTEIVLKDRKEQVWRYGVILNDEKGSIALVRERDREIQVSVKGSAKSNYISDIRETLNDIFESYKSLQPTLSYKIVGDDVAPNRDLYLSEQKIVNHVKNGEDYYDDVLDQKISLRAVKELYKIFSDTNVNHYHGDNQTHIGGDNRGVVKSTTINFKDCNLDLQGNLNYLIEKLSKTVDQEDLEDLQKVVTVLAEIEDNNNKEEVKEILKKNSVSRRLGDFVEDLGDEKSSMAKKIKGVKNGAKVVKDIVTLFNKAANWAGMDTIQDIALNLLP